MEALEKASKIQSQYHIAVKKMSYLDEAGNWIEPEKPNAYKFEAFLFDAFGEVDEMAVLRVKREEEFAPVKNSDDAKWNERFGKKHENNTNIPKDEEKESDGNNVGGMSNMIEIKEMKSLDEVAKKTDDNQLQEVTNEQTMRLQYLFQKLIKDAVAANNEEMEDHLVERITQNVKGDLCKELDYQFRLMEERDEERVNIRHEVEDKRNEDYYKRIDELLRQYSGKNAKQKEKNKEKNKEKTILFPSSKDKQTEKGEPKAKREFHFFRKAVEAKIE